MEPTNLDDLFKRTVESTEEKAELNPKQKDALWKRVHEEPKQFLWLWKAASIALLCSTAFLSWSVYNANQKIEVLAEQKSQRDQKVESLVAEMKTFESKPAEVIYKEVQTEPILSKPEIKYIIKEKVVIEENLITQTDYKVIDSLKQEIESRDEALAILEQSKSEVRKSDPAQNVMVAFQEPQMENQSNKKSESKLKFQFALLNNR